MPWGMGGMQWNVAINNEVTLQIVQPAQYRCHTYPTRGKSLGQHGARWWRGGLHRS